MRTRVSLLALAAIAIFVAGVFTGRLIRAGSHGQATPTPPGGATWDALLARTLSLPQMGSDGVCPTSPRQTLEVSALDNGMRTVAHGKDPAYVVPGAEAGGMPDIIGRDRVQLLISPAYHGALLVRGMRLDTRSSIGFGETLQLDGTTDGWYSATGRPKAIGVPQDTPHTATATFDGHIEPTWNALRLPAGTGIRPGSTQPPWQGEGWRLFSWLQDPTATGCYALQLDGPNLGIVVVFQI
ncbi:MAG TPA: hypothetical protein VEQ12_07525 [Candidatus Limnocylindria bacterium]|nr:hypothetical protein [Candidatus Limnocylindria bacterium]